jgi:DnaJ-domain-containing protein 1
VDHSRRRTECKEGIVRSYRRKIKECHPDRLAGVAPPLLQMAEEQAKVLNGAYANAMRARR